MKQVGLSLLEIKRSRCMFLFLEERENLYKQYERLEAEQYERLEAKQKKRPSGRDGP